jgi:Mrp family chromosome partitioning ATPase/capsular polysaccharide biosynthesis protein
MNDATPDASIFSPLWKRKWLILAVAILVAAGTYEYYKRQPAIYTAKTALYLGGAAEQASSLGVSPGKSTLSGRALVDQVELINTTINEQVRKRLREEEKLVIARTKAKAAASGASDFITITTEGHNPKAAVALANDLAAAYILRQRSDYLRNLRSQIANTKAQLRRIETPSPKTKGSKGGPSNTATIQAASLESRISQLESALLTFTGVTQVGSAKASPLPVSPMPKQNAIFGFVLGLILGAVVAYGLGRLDRRMRSLGAIEAAFQTPILAALPSVGSPVKRPDGTRYPARSLVEPLRRLQTTLRVGEALRGERGLAPKVILFLGAEAGDGSSSLIANLARVQRDAGERVAIVEANFRRPAQSRLLDVGDARGLVEVLSGTASVGAAIQTVAPAAADVEEEATPPGGAVATVVQSATAGSLSVLLGGAAVANPPALLGGEAMPALLRSLTVEYDSVLIDAPPPLEVSDAMALLPLVDGIIIVARVAHTRDISAERLTELLQRTPSAPVLGVVANGVPRKDLERHGFSAAPTGRRVGRLIGR